MALMGLSGTGGTVPPDWIHTNAVAYNADFDQIVLSSYGFSEFWIIDHSTTKEETAGHILVFNNGPYRPDGAYSSVDEIVLPVDDQGRYARQEEQPFGPEGAIWSYTATDKKTNFHSMHISGAERLINGNTLICSGAYGVLFE